MKRWRSLCVLFLAVTAVYFYAYPTASFIFGAVLLHTGLGVILALGLAMFLLGGIRGERWMGRLGWMLLAATGIAWGACVSLRPSPGAKWVAREFRQRKL